MTSRLTRHAAIEIGALSPAPAARLGSWASLLAAGLTVAFVALTLLLPADPWRDLDAYAASFTTVEVVQLVPILLLAPVVVVLMICLHHVAVGSRQVASQIAVTFAAIYATIITVNYALQLVVVRFNIAAGEIEELLLLVMPNPRSVFVALEVVGYGFFALMALAAATTVLSGRGLERWVRYTFLATGITGLVGAAGGLAGQRIVMLTGFGLSLLAFLAATVLLGVHFLRLTRTGATPCHPTRSRTH
jgi:hypothetical protein